MAKERQSVRVLTTENWRDSRRCRRSAGIYASTWVEELPDGRFRTFFYTARNDWDTLEQALAYANGDTGGVHVFFGDVPAGAPVEMTYDPATDTISVHAPDLSPGPGTGDNET